MSNDINTTDIEDILNIPLDPGSEEDQLMKKPKVKVIKIDKDGEQEGAVAKPPKKQKAPKVEKTAEDLDKSVEAILQNLEADDASLPPVEVPDVPVEKPEKDSRIPDVLNDVLEDVDEPIAEDGTIQIPSSDVVSPPVVQNDPSVALSLSLQAGSSLSKQIADPQQSDKLLKVVREGRATLTVLNAIMEEIAEEAAYIKAWRAANWDTQKDLSEATYKRIRMMESLVKTLAEKEKIRKDKDVGKIDFSSESFQRVLQHFLGIIEKVFKEVNIPEQYEGIFFTNLAKTFDGFEKKAEKIYYGKDR